MNQAWHDKAIAAWLHGGQLYQDVYSMVELLMGDLQGQRAESRPRRSAGEELAERRRGLVGRWGPAQGIVNELPENSPQANLQNLIAALDLIFEARYGWPPGTAAKKTLPEIFIALEHALEYDAPGKPSVWRLTLT